MRLYDHQEYALQNLPSRGGYLAFEQGLGKTITAIRYAEKHGYRKVLVVAPAIVLGVWDDELEGYDRHLPKGSRKQKAEQIASYVPVEHIHYCIINYEALVGTGDLEAAVNKWDPDLIIIDEAQKIKNATAKRSKVLHRLTKERSALLLSGTPITKNLLDLYSQYKAIDPAIWDHITWTKFKQTYAIMGGFNGYEVIGYRDVDEMKARIKPHTIVARKEDTLDLPTKTHQLVPVGLSPAGWADYRAMARDGVAREWVTTTPLEKALRLSQISGMDKLGFSIDFIKALAYDSDESVVVYFRYLAEGDALSTGLDVPVLTGATPMGTRRTMVDDFQGGRLPIFLSQVQAGSTGITLTRASHMVYHSLSYAYEDWAQSQDRIHRIGQTMPVNYYYIVAQGPKGGILIDQLLLNSLNGKEDLAGTITRDPDLLIPKEIA